MNKCFNKCCRVCGREWWWLFQDSLLYIIPVLVALASFTQIQLVFWTVLSDIDEKGRYWLEWEIKETQWLFIIASCDLITCLILIRNYYQTKQLRRELSKARRKHRMKQWRQGIELELGRPLALQDLDDPDMTQDRLARVHGRLSPLDFCYVVSRGNYLLAFTASFVTVGFAHSLQLVHFLSLPEEVKKIYSSFPLWHILNYSAFCLFTFAVYGLHVLVTFPLAWGSAMYFWWHEGEQRAEEHYLEKHATELKQISGSNNPQSVTVGVAT